MQATLKAFSSLRKAAAKGIKTLLLQEEGRAESIVQAMQCFASLYQVKTLLPCPLKAFLQGKFRLLSNQGFLKLHATMPV